MEDWKLIAKPEQSDIRSNYDHKSIMMDRFYEGISGYSSYPEGLSRGFEDVPLGCVQLNDIICKIRLPCRVADDKIRALYGDSIDIKMNVKGDNGIATLYNGTTL